MLVPDLQHILSNLRPADAEEAQAAMPGSDLADSIMAHEVAHLLAATAAVGFTAAAVAGGVQEPVAFVHAGTGDVRDGQRWTRMSMLATDQWTDAIGCAITRRCHRQLIPKLIAGGYTHADAWAIDSHTVSHAWMQRTFGAEIVATDPNFCGSGRTFFHFVRVLADVHRATSTTKT